MPQPYDATTKALLETRPADWLPLLGYPAGQRVRVIDADLATVTAAADKVLRVGTRSPWLLQIELQASRDPDLLRRVRLYNALLDDRHRLPVGSVVVLLRESADDPELTGVVERWLATGERYLVFNYHVVRLWEVPVETLLAGPLGILPLAPLSRVDRGNLPAIVRRMGDRLAQETTPAEAAVFWSSTYVLMGLRYPPELADQLLEGVRAMRESLTWQAIFKEGEQKGKVEGKEEGKEEGKVEGMRDLLLHLGTRRFGPPDAISQAALAKITDLVRLQALSDRLLDVSSWQELLPPTTPKPRRRRKRTT